MRSMWFIFSKEFLDIIRDRRRFILMLLTTFVVMPILFVVPYAYIINRTAHQSAETLTIPVQGMDYAPTLLSYLEKHDIQSFAAEDVDALVQSKKYSVGLIIPPDFEEKINSGRSAEVVLVTDRRRAINVLSERLRNALNDYGSELMQERLAERSLASDFFTPLTIQEQNAATTTETAGSLMGLFIPGFILGIALSAGMPIAVSAIAGEKKKLTLEPVLFTTVNRFQLVFAKLLAVLASVIITLLSLGLSVSLAAVGALVFLSRSLPMDKILSSATETTVKTPSSSGVGAGYHLESLAVLLLLLAPFLIILLGAAFQILVSTWARNDEEASTYLTPLGLFSSMLFLAAFFLDDFVPSLWHYGIPVLGTILSMRDLLSNKLDPASLTVMFGTSAFYALLMIVLAVWMFHREEVVFRT